MSGTKRVRAPPFEATQLAVHALSDAKQAALLRWLVRHQETTGVLEHAKRYLHRCRVRDCAEFPRTLRDVEAFEERKCPECDILMCEDHYDVQTACSRAECRHHRDERCCECRQGTCNVCGDPLCVECYNTDYPNALCDLCEAATQRADDSEDELALPVGLPAAITATSGAV